MAAHRLRRSADRAQHARHRRRVLCCGWTSTSKAARDSSSRAAPSRAPCRSSTPCNSGCAGGGAVNNLELKLIDPSGQNVWRYVFKDLQLPQRWKRFVVPSRDIEFAWGPSSGAAISELGFIEVAVVAGEGGAGSVLIAGLEIEDLTPSHPPIAQCLERRARIFRRGCADRSAAGGPGATTGHPGSPSTARRPAPSADSSSIGSSGRRRRAFVCAPRSAASAGKRCTRRRMREASAATSICRGCARASCASKSSRLARARSLRLEPFEFSRSIEAFWYAVAAAESARLASALAAS